MGKQFSQQREQMSRERRGNVEAKTEKILEKMALVEVRRAREVPLVQLAQVLGIRQPG